MRVLDDHTLIVAEGPASQVSRIVIGQTSAIRTSLGTVKEVASVVVVGDDVWAIEGQILRFVAMPPQTPDLPFLVRRIRNVK